MASNNGFFKKRQGAAVFKHALLRRYLPVFVGKTGSTAADKLVVYIDGFAGIGAYDDGSPGSPILAATLAKAMSSRRNLQCFYVEKQMKYAKALELALAGIDHKFELIRGSAAEEIPAVMKRIGVGPPLFAFLDPFGLVALPFDLVVRVLRRAEMPGAVSNAPTEVLLNFSITSLRRVGGFLQIAEAERTPKQRAALDNLDAALGGKWWREIWTSTDSDKERAIVSNYTALVRAAVADGYVSWVVPVSDTWDGPVAYLLVLFTRSRDGIYEFNESLSLARDEHLKFCIPDQPPMLIDTRRGAIVGRLVRNLSALLEHREEFVVLDEFPRIFEGVGGDARETHLREAVKYLHNEGAVEHDGKGDLKKAKLRRTRR